MSWVAVGAAAVSAAGGIANGMLNKAQAPAQAQYTPVNPAEIESQTVNAALSNLGSAQSLSSSTNAFNSQQALQALNTALPGYSGLASSLMGQASSLAANPYAIPQSVVGQLSQYAAENNINEGTGASSGFSGSNTLRSLGINALQYGQTNLQTASGLLSTLTGTAPNVAPTSPLSFMLSPSSVLSNQQLTNTTQQASQQAANNASAAANNYNTANLWDSLTASQGSMNSLYAALTGGTNIGSGGGTSVGTIAPSTANAEISALGGTTGAASFMP